MMGNVKPEVSLLVQEIWRMSCRMLQMELEAWKTRLVVAGERSFQWHSFEDFRSNTKEREV